MADCYSSDDSPRIAEDVGEDVGARVVCKEWVNRATQFNWALFQLPTDTDWVLRLFRYGRGECETRWMDEHIKVEGSTADFKGELIDENLNSLTWWTEKHNWYASREAVDLLNLEYGFMEHDSVAGLGRAGQPGVKRWLKERVYARLPRGVRAFAYFAYRYLFRMGFLDGREERLSTSLRVSGTATWLMPRSPR